MESLDYKKHLEIKVKNYIEKKIEEFKSYNPYYGGYTPYIVPDEFLDFILEVKDLVELI